MRHVLTSFLALHWAVVFALLAYICMDGNRGIASALGVLGVSLQSSRFPDLDHALVVAPLAVALLIVALLFCWAFVETLLNIATRPDAGDTVVRIAFICASFLLSVILVGGAAQGINGLFMVVAIQMTALLASYVAVLAERRSASTAMTLHEGEAPLVSRRMAAGVAHSSLLSRISSRPETRPGGRR
ncbi:hypothetical protein EOA75_15060 [Mesorhizobium sp. M1A.F.Ca.IN.022.07.1.1]|uniref:hypothetical protein n=1 Tax=unclassified Mesorhizobium TaxID=325217 RepID=UPI000FCC8823|nr:MULTISPECIES: hypothetical protein [unclassified Mesorhizobium]RUV93111.1 hypothetical protein EOA75_15060 [Mesorhizobium sp. M1A.F.Ca.IN.022.07.1.1]RWG01306.1 MAG: hypothetical protein EOQ54_23665 [Mesorhizobium sp.]RWG57448.1 MAG: hypothetical protein EOQ64_10475 [Mesorhizobium sp.]RWG96437.1 MAG: hypothetical protein EOQ72_21830 [Mesorhizobium sp.]RWH41064.1 MAG: hypothetical protein EOQ79_01420 [Mesorhizobium sp.]